MESWKWYVYIIECFDGSDYTGMTWSPDGRWEQHLEGLGSTYTTEHPPKAMVYVEEYEDLETAREREKQINGMDEKKERKTNQWGMDSAYLTYSPSTSASRAGLRSGNIDIYAKWTGHG